MAERKQFYATCCTIPPGSDWPLQDSVHRGQSFSPWCKLSQTYDHSPLQRHSHSAIKPALRDTTHDALRGSVQMPLDPASVRARPSVGQFLWCHVYESKLWAFPA